MPESERADRAVEAELKVIRRLLEGLQTGLRPAAVSLEGAAKILSCSPRHVARLVKAGVLSPCSIGSLRRIPVAQLEELLATPQEKSHPKLPRPRYDAAAASARLAELRGKKR